MNEHPILFSGVMVRAILDGRKTQTRRVMKYQPEDLPIYGPELYAPVVIDRYGEEQPGDDIFGVYGEEWGLKFPYGQPGDRLWVRETWRPCCCQRCNAQFGHGAKPFHEAEYRADGDDPHGWKPSIHMPRWASRITLEITNVRVERLQSISEEDALAEGVQLVNGLFEIDLPESHSASCVRTNKAVGTYMVLWDEINRRDFSWNVNPWVWVIEFKRVDMEVSHG